MNWPTAITEKPKSCMVCKSKVNQPIIYKPDHSKWNRWPYKLLQELRATWIVSCTRCPAIHVWSHPNVYKVYTDPINNIILGDN